MRVFHDKDIPIEKGNEEAFAYYLEFVIREGNKIFKKTNVKHK